MRALRGAQRRTVLFDLDGTLSDSAAGIIGSLRRALADHGQPPMSAEFERSVLGPPLYEILPEIVDIDLVEPVLTTYRGYYAGGGMFQTAAYPGTRELLETLRADGRRLAVATSKPEPYAEPILERLQLREFFETVAGDDLRASRPTKASVVGHALAHFGDPDPSHVIMIGDRKHDVIGARAHGVDCIAVRWGYAAAGELDLVEPVATVDEPAQIAVLLEAGLDR